MWRGNLPLDWLIFDVDPIQRPRWFVHNSQGNLRKSFEKVKMNDLRLLLGDSVYPRQYRDPVVSVFYIDQEFS